MGGYLAQVRCDRATMSQSKLQRRPRVADYVEKPEWPDPLSPDNLEAASKTLFERGMWFSPQKTAFDGATS